jgi:hypothetical protein
MRLHGEGRGAGKAEKLAVRCAMSVGDVSSGGGCLTAAEWLMQAMDRVPEDCTGAAATEQQPLGRAATPPEPALGVHDKPDLVWVPQRRGEISKMLGGGEWPASSAAEYFGRDTSVALDSGLNTDDYVSEAESDNDGQIEEGGQVTDARRGGSASVAPLTGGDVGKDTNDGDCDDNGDKEPTEDAVPVEALLVGRRRTIPATNKLLVRMNLQSD